MAKTTLENLSERIKKHLLIKPELKERLIAVIPGWDESERASLARELDALDEELANKLQAALQDEEKRKAAFHKLSEIKVKLQHGQ